MSTTSKNCAGVISAAIYTALAPHDLSVAEIFRRIYVEPADFSVESQIRQANDFWRVRLGHVCSDLSIQVRGALVDCDLENWIRLFATEVAPYVAKINPRLD